MKSDTRFGNLIDIALKVRYGDDFQWNKITITKLDETNSYIAEIDIQDNSSLNLPLTLSQAIKLIIYQRRASIRDIASELGMNTTTIWRAIRYPRQASAKSLLAIIRWAKISQEDLYTLWDREKG